MGDVASQITWSKNTSELDGGIDAVTAPLGVAAGANVLVAGSAIFDNDVKRLQAAANQAVN